jgi:hypothetical protein
MLAYGANALACSDPGCAVDLGTAADFAILSKSGITNVAHSDITGDMGVSPIAVTAITGFTLIADASNEYATSAQVSGKIYAPDYAASKMTAAIGDMEAAYTDAASRTTSDPAEDFLDLGSGDISGRTLKAGVYTWSSSIGFNGDITLQGTGAGNDDIFILRTTGNVLAAAGANVVLANGATAKNIFWQVAGYVQLGAGAHVEGIFLVKTHVAFITGASLNGRVLSQTAATIQMATIAEQV